jgi:hypothetical protein
MTLIQAAAQAQDTIDQLNLRVASLASELATLTTEHTALEAYKSTMESRVTSVLSSGDPAQYEALATEFLTPAEEKARLAKVAQLAALQAQAAALEAELA